MDIFAETLFKTQWYLIYGRCYTFEAPEAIVKLNIEDISLRLKIDSFVFVHHPGQFTSSNSKTKIPAAKGTKMFMDLTHEVTNDMPKASFQQPYY